ncbi:MAG: 2-oxoacid:acceptor oxidoreductase family protein [Candidatus Thorarchaeota archaeon]
MNETENVEIIIHGRGGQGAVTACEIIAEAAYLSGNFFDVHAYPSFGAERRGAPVQAYAKLSRTDTIWDRAQIENPNILIVFDETVLNPEIISSLKHDGIFIINSEKEPDFFINEYNLSTDVKIAVADISTLALEKNLTIDGNPVINTPILGLLSKVLPDLSLDNLKTVVLKRMGEKLGKLNYELIEQGYNLAKIK